MKVEDDILQSWITRIINFYYREKKRFLIVLSGIAVALVVLIISLTSKPRENPEVQLRFTQALGLYSIGNLTHAEEQFLELTRLFGNTPLGNKAHFYLGNIYYQTQRYLEAQKAFERFYAKNKKNPLLAPAALMGIANSYEELEELKKAATAYENVYKRYPKSPIAPEALAQAGRCYILLGDYHQAIKIFEKLIKKYPNYKDIANAKAQLWYAKASSEKRKLP